MIEIMDVGLAYSKYIPSRNFGNTLIWPFCMLSVHFLYIFLPVCLSSRSYLSLRSGG
jgi:hypothetical protein